MNVDNIFSKANRNLNTDNFKSFLSYTYGVMQSRMTKQDSTILEKKYKNLKRKQENEIEEKE